MTAGNPQWWLPGGVKVSVGLALKTNNPTKSSVCVCVLRPSLMNNLATCPSVGREWGTVDSGAPGNPPAGDAVGLDGAECAVRVPYSLAGSCRPKAPVPGRAVPVGPVWSGNAPPLAGLPFPPLQNEETGLDGLFVNIYPEIPGGGDTLNQCVGIRGCAGPLRQAV